MDLTNMTTTVKKKTSKGRRKIEIKKIEDKGKRLVAFSKRRPGLFKKASELCVLTGAQVAILVKSPGDRVFAFGHPNVDHIVDRYLNTNTDKDNGGDDDVTNTMMPLLPMQDFNQHYAEVSRRLETEKKQLEDVIIPSSSSRVLPWFEEAVDGLDVHELEEYLWSLNQLKNKVLTRANDLNTKNKASVPLMLGGGLHGYDLGFSGGQTVADGGGQGGFGFQHGGEN